MGPQFRDLPAKDGISEADALNRAQVRDMRARGAREVDLVRRSRAAQR
jgi:hypothetical protein